MNMRWRSGTIAAVLMAGALSAPTAAQPAPDARIYFHGNAVAFIAGVSGGKGMLIYRGRHLPLDVSGVSFGEIGVHHYDVVGEVYGLHDVRDIEGTYAAVHASATAGGGGGAITMQNSRGVQIQAHSTTAGLALALGPKGVQIRLERY
jgi:hypothetical protein